MTLGNVAKHVRRAPSMRAQHLVGYLPAGKIDKSFSKKAARNAWTRLFHDGLRLICQSLFGPAANGIRLADSRGFVRTCHPLLASYVANYPEQCLVACTRYGQACPICPKRKKRFGYDECGLTRQQLASWAVIDAVMKANGRVARRTALDALNDAGLNPVDRPFWLCWPHTNIHILLTADVLHQLVQGMGKHLVQWLIELADAKELDSHIQCIPLSHPLRHFKDGITDLSNISGTEHKAIYAQILGCVHGIVPVAAVKAATALLDFLYIVQYVCHSADTLADLEVALTEFHTLKDVFKIDGVRKGVSCRCCLPLLMPRCSKTSISRSYMLFSTMRNRFDYLALPTTIIQRRPSGSTSTSQSTHSRRPTNATLPRKCATGWNGAKLSSGLPLIWPRAVVPSSRPTCLSPATWDARRCGVTQFPSQVDPIASASQWSSCVTSTASSASRPPCGHSCASGITCGVMWATRPHSHVASRPLSACSLPFRPGTLPSFGHQTHRPLLHPTLSTRSTHQVRLGDSIPCWCKLRGQRQPAPVDCAVS